MKISVVIATLNERPVIGRAVESAWSAGFDEVLVVDGGSLDETRDVVRGRCRILDSPPGRGTQQHLGVVAAGGDVLLFQHADNWWECDAADQVRRALRHPRVVGGYFRQAIDDPRRLFRVIERGNAFRARRLGLPYGDQAIFVRREALGRIGGFPRTPIMEDVLLGRRLSRIGHLSLLPGPLRVSSRRWRSEGVVRQTLRNWLLLAAFQGGVPPRHLARFYPVSGGT